MEPLSGESGNVPDEIRNIIRTGASMEPLSGESGNDWTTGRGNKNLTSFNGAALRRERKLHYIHDPDKATLRFNGAALRRERKREQLDYLSGEAAGASMEPLSGESGNVAKQVDSAHWAKSFNGAALRRERKHAALIERRLDPLASMEPLSGESGNFRRRGPAQCRGAASMEPLSGESGNLKH